MSSYEKTRTKIFSAVQHIYSHSLDEMEYVNPNLPGDVTDAKEAMDWVFNLLYPKSKPSVATPADLPTGVDTPNPGDLPPDPKDMRFVSDDGDGNAALYQWEQYDGDLSYEWKKIADMDWGVSGVVSALIDQTQPLYVLKFGTTDYDLDTELPLAGDLAGQHIYGGDTANQNLTLHANNGDAPGAHTGAVQVDDLFRPFTDLEFNLGDATHRWNNAYMGTAIIGTGTMTITSDGVNGSITDTSGSILFGDDNLTTTGNFNASDITASSSLVVDSGANSTTITPGQILSSTGALSFGDENVSTTGTIASGAHTVSNDLVLSTGSITSVSGAIDFGNEALSTTGSITSEFLYSNYLRVDDIILDAQTITTQASNLTLTAFGADVNVLKRLVASAGGIFTGTFAITGQLDVDLLTFDGNNITSSNSEIFISGALGVGADAMYDMGSTPLRWRALYLSDGISDGTNLVSMATLTSLRDILSGANAGDAIFWDGAKFVTSNPDTEIVHSEISGLGSDDHAQYALLAGRTGGQTFYGSDTTGQSLIIGDNSVNNNRIELGNAFFRPVTTATVSLGDVSNRFTDLYMGGQAYGMQVENTTTVGLGSLPSAGTPGRMFYNTDDTHVYVDRGGSAFKISNNSYNTIHTNVALGSAITVSSFVSDARECIWQLCDLQNNEEIIYTAIQKTATQVTIVNAGLLPVGNYRLIGIQI